MLLDPVADQTMNLPIIWYFWWSAGLWMAIPFLLTVREITMLWLRLKAKKDIPAIRAGKVKVILEYAGITLYLFGGGWMVLGYFILVFAVYSAYLSFAVYYTEASDANHRA